MMTAALPALPLLIFLLVFLVAPILFILRTAIYDPEIARALPETTRALQSWPGVDVPDADIFAILGRELEKASGSGTLRPLGRRVGYELSRGMNVVLDAARAFRDDFDRADAAAWKSRLIAANPTWGKPAIWRIIKRHSGHYSTFYLGWALGLHVIQDADGRPLSEQGYDFQVIFVRTLAVSLAVTLLTVLIGYPIAYVATNASGHTRALLLFLILLPFWTSLLVRTMSWVVVLQTNGVLNSILAAFGLIEEPLSLLYTRTATILAMTQIQLPFTVLPMISVMRTISPNQLRAARSLGAGPIRSHIDIFTPQAVPGIAAGALVTFVLCLGFYITPALVGGPTDQLVSSFIARFTNDELNWGLASALSLVLLIGAGAVAVPLARNLTRNATRTRF